MMFMVSALGIFFSSFFFVIGLFPFSVFSQTNNEIEKKISYGGESQWDFLMHTLPSGKSGSSQFKWTFLRLHSEVNFPTLDVSLFFQVRAGWNKENATSRSNVNNVLIDRGYFQVRDFFLKKQFFKAGLIPHPWREFVDRNWSHSDMYYSGESLMFRYRYLFAEDYGISWSYVGDIFGFDLMLTNGEGNQNDQNDEDGVRKDLHLQLTLGSWFGIYCSVGAYEKLPSESNSKKRCGLFVGYRPESGVGFGLEGFRGFDSVDAIDGIIADKVNLTSYGGQIAESEGGSGFVFVRRKRDLGYWELYFRGDHLTPMKSIEDKEIRTLLWGFDYCPQESIVYSFSQTTTEYQVNHSVAAKNTQFSSISTKISF